MGGTPDKTQELKDLEAERERHVTRVFWLTLEIVLVLAIPAVAASFLVHQVGKWSGFFAFPIAIALSWTYIMRKYKKVKNKLEDLDRKINDLRGELEK